MTQQPVELFEMPENILFSLKDVVYTPTAPRLKEPFIVKGKVKLLGLSFLGPIWVIATVVYPETWWEEIIPIIGAPEKRETDIGIGGDFEIAFKTGFIREGEFKLFVRLYPGPTFPIDSIVIPPVPAFATAEATFIVAGDLPPQEENFRLFRILSYAKGAGAPVTSPGVLNLNVGDVCRVNLAFEHTGPAVTGELHAAIGNWKGITWPIDFSLFDEVLDKDKAFSIPASVDWKSYTTGYYVDIIITSAISKGAYDLYAKVMGITGGDVFTPYLKDVITIAGGVPPGGWQVLDQLTGIVIRPLSAGGWQVLDQLTGIVIRPLSAGGWQVLDQLTGIVIRPAVEQLVSITVQINADAAVWAFPGANRWQAWYWDPKAQKFVGDGGWHYLTPWLPGGQIGFENIVSGGYLAVYLWDGDTNRVSDQFNSPEWDAVDGGHYEYNPYSNQIYPV